MTASFYHPVLGHPALTRETLLSRCKPQAAAVFTAASRLAAYRILQEENAEKLLAQSQPAPFLETTEPLPRTPVAMTRTDLLRALLAYHADDIKACAFGALPLDASFEESVLYWRGMAEGLTISEVPTEIEQGWGRRLQMMLLAAPTWRFELRGMLSLLLDEPTLSALALFSKDCKEGRRTRSEIADKLGSNCLASLFQLDADTSTGITPMVLPPTNETVGIPLCTAVPSIYFDWYEGLSALDEAFAKDAAVVLISEKEGQGRRALVEAWVMRLKYEQKPLALSTFQYGTALFAPGVSSPGAFYEDQVSQSAQIYSLKPKEGGGRGKLAIFNPSELLAEITYARANPEKARLLLTMTQEDYRIIQAKLPEIDSLPQVLVPTLTERELLPLWLCQLPLLEYSIMSQRPSIDELFRALRLTPRELQWKLSEPAHLMHEIGRALALRPFEREEEHALTRPSWTMLLKRAGPDNPEYLFDSGKAPGSFYSLADRFLGSPERFALIQELAQALDLQKK